MSAIVTVHHIGELNCHFVIKSRVCVEVAVEFGTGHR
jgi:hypothetical protein